MENHRALINSLIEKGVLPAGSEPAEIIETHISTVVLTGDYAFKFKKPVNFGFLDFSTLEARKHFCEEELRLNQRLAPGLYLQVVSITGSAEQPELNGHGPALEYAVKMRQFDQTQLLDRKLRDGTLDAALIDETGDRIAGFHAMAAVAGGDSQFCHPSTIYAPMEQNFRQLAELITDTQRVEQLARIEQWTRQRFTDLTVELENRGKDGFIRECHGDMHLGNMTLVDGEVTIFDGIEFNDEFRWIDVMSEMAFVTMDLTDRGATKLANRLLNRYLEHTGDYQGLSLLRFYQVYRAVVRAKIASFRLADPSLGEADRLETLAQYQSYADLAEQFTQQHTPQLLLMHGVSGSGKSTVSRELAAAIDAIRIRSDAERKRLYADRIETRSEFGQGLYTSEISAAVYDHLLTLSAPLLDAGFNVIVDAAFLKHAQRAPFLEMAAKKGLPCHVIALECEPNVLRQRVRDRRNDVSDADLDVLEHQLVSVQTPRSDENAIPVDTRGALNIEKFLQRLVS